jgi:hypothetical protein
MQCGICDTISFAQQIQYHGQTCIQNFVKGILEMYSASEVRPEI